jgi:Domain of Unknown Function (DUF1080)
MKTLLFTLMVAPSLLLAADFRPLFNGKDTSGWKMTGPGRFVVEDGLLKTEGGMGLLFYEKEKLGNCVVKAVFKTATDHANSGLIIRLPEPPPDPWYGVHNGFEVQIDGGGDEWHSTGAIYSLSKVSSRQQKPKGEWNTMEVEIKGKTTKISVNGVLVNTYQDGQPVPERVQWYEPVRGPRADAGYIGLQNHDKNSTVYFKEISVRPLP